MQQFKKKSSKTVMRALALVLAFAMIATSVAISPVAADAASKKKKTKVKVSKVTITKPATSVLVLKKGKTYTLKKTVTVKPNKKANKKVTFKSSNKKVATVTSKGKIKAKKAGKAVITVTSKKNSKKKDKITVRVGTPITKITVKTTKKTIKVGKTFTLKVKKITPKKATYKKAYFTSKNKKIASVNKKTGKVKGVKAGTTYIYAKAADGSGKSAKCKVTVKAEATTVVDPYAGMTKVEDFESYAVGTNWTLSTRKNEKATLTVIADPENANNKLLEVKPAGYDTTPVIDINLPEGKTLGNYSSVMASFRVKDSTDAANKRVAAFFDEQGKITATDTNFMTYDPFTREGILEAKPDTTEEDIKKQIKNNRFSKDMVHATAEDDGTYNYFMPQYSETRAKNGEAQEAGWQTGNKVMKLVFNNAIMDKAVQEEGKIINLFTLNKLSMAIGATYNEKEEAIGTDEQTVWYLDNVYLVPKPEQKVLATAVAIKGAPEDGLVGVNNSLILTSEVLPKEATDKSVDWSVEPANMATINANGELKTKDIEGEITVTATTRDGSNLKASTKLTVYKKVVKEDLVLDLTKLATKNEGTPKIAYEATLEPAPEKGEGFYKFTSTTSYGNVLFDLGEKMDMSGYKQVNFTGESGDQMGFELYPDTLDMSSDTYYKAFAEGGQRVFDTYPFYNGTHAYKPGYGPGEENGNKQTGLGDTGNIDATTPLQVNTDGALLKGSLSNVRYVNFKHNADTDTAEAPYVMYLKEIRFVARGEEKDVAEDFTMIKDNYSQDFNGANVNLDDVKEIRNSDANAVLGTWASEEPSNGYAQVTGSDTNGAQFFLDNRDGAAEKTFYIKAKVRATEENGKYKLINFGVKTDYATSMYHGALTNDAVNALASRRMGDEWLSIATTLTVPTGKFVQLILKSNFAYDLDDVVVKEYNAATDSLEVEPDPVEPVTAVAENFTIDFDAHDATINKSESDATIEKIEDPENADNHLLSYTYGEDTYGKVFSYFNVKLAAGTKLSNYKEIKIRYNGVAGDIGWKKLVMLAANKATGFPEEIDYAYQTNTASNIAVVAKQEGNVNGTGWKELTLPIDATMAEAITDEEIQVGFYLNVGATGGTPAAATQYQFDDIEFVAKNPNPENIAIDMNTATITEGVSGGAVADPEDAENQVLQLTYDTAQYGGAYAKFDVNLGDFELKNYKSVKLRYRGVAGDVGYKKLFLLAADKATGLPAEISYDWDSSSFTNATEYATAVSVNGTGTWNEIELIIDPEKASTLTSKELTFTVFMNAGNASSDVKTSYMFDDIEFIADAPAQLVDVEIDPSTLNAANEGVTASVVADPDDAEKDALDILYGTSQYGSAYVKGDLPLNGFNLSDYESITFRYRGVAGDVGYKNLYFLAADKETGLPAEISYDWGTSAFTNVTDYASHTQVNGTDEWKEITLTIDSEKAATLDGKDIEYSIFMNAGGSASDVSTEYMYSDIVLVAKKDPVLSDIAIDMDTATITEGVSGGAVEDPEDAENQVLQLTYDTAQYGGAYAKFDLNLGDFELKDYKSVKLRYRGVAGDVGYKKLFLLAADKETGLPAEIAYDWDSSSFTNATEYATAVSVNGTGTWNEIELVIDPEKASTLTSKDLTFSIFMNAGNASSDVKTSYMFDDIEFVANPTGAIVE